jgi:hypothetical protein
MMEGGPLYAVAARRAGIPRCLLTFDPVGSVEVAYRFGELGSLRVQRDESIEYFELDARLALTRADRPKELLARSARSAFGACGIDWTHAETRALDRARVETIFRGETCNCQARIRHDGAGHVVGLALRSAC